MAFDTRYVAAFNIEDVLLDKDTGQPLTAGKVYFEVFNQPGVPKPVWQVTYSSGIYTYVELPNPMILSSIGTFEDALENPVIPYFFPFDADGEIQYYRVRVLSSGDVEQFVRDPVPSVPSGGSGSSAGAFQNELSNPQFSEVLFDTSTASYIYSFNTVVGQVVTIAPDWEIVVTAPAAGTVTVSQVKPTGSLNIPTNPAALLTINSSGVTSLVLRQRLLGTPNIWGNGSVDGNGGIAATFVAKVAGGTSATLLLRYSQSNGAIVNETIVNATLPGSGEYDVYPGGITLLASTSTQTFPDAYVDIFFEIPVSREVTISSVMVTGTGPTAVTDLLYEQEPINRQIDHLFHYYKPQLEFKPIRSMLVGWDFPLNPAQARGTTVTMPTSASIPTAENCYIWDQTIGNSLVSSIAVVRNTVTGGFQATTASNDEAFYLIQYLSGAQAKKILGTPLSVNINAFRSQAGGVVTCKVYLYSARAAATFPTLPTMIGTVAADGVFTLTAANWTLIPRGNLGQASAALPTVSTLDYSSLNTIDDLGFSGWEMTTAAQLADTDKFAIVVTFSCPTTATVVTVNSISMVPGEIPTRPGPQTADEVRSDCWFYYNKSFRNDIVPAQGLALITGELSGAVSSAGATQNSLNMYLPIGMRTLPVITPYSPVVLSNQAYNNTAGACTGILTAVSSEKFFYFTFTGNAAGNLTQTNSVHWSAEARLGIV